MTAEEVKEELKPSDSAVDVTPNKDGGVLKEVLVEGKGEERPGQNCKVKVHYEGRLLDGSVFDSSRERSAPFEFDLGKGSVIKAWDIGVATMREGEKAKFFCREDYAYGKSGSSPKIPPGATLVFEIEMLGWDAEDLSGKKDKGILRYPIVKGEGVTTPNEGAAVEVSLVGEYNGKVFDEREVSFDLGEGEAVGVPPGVERALEKFALGEKSRLVLAPGYAFGSAGRPDDGVPGGATVTYTVTLKKFEKMKDSWMLESKEKLEHGKMLKEKGTKYFTAQKYNLALKMYKKMLDYVEYSAGFEEDLETERKSLLLAAHLNVSMCHLKLNNFNSARSQCEKALEQDANNIKALFRRGQAYLALNEPDKAITDFERVIALDPSNKAATVQVAACKKKIKEIRGREKEIYANMFEKYTQKKEVKS